MNDASSIHDNGGDRLDCPNCYRVRGAGVLNRGTLVMDDTSSIHHNVAGPTPNFGGIGGGVYNEGTLKMRGSSSIHDNTAYGDGELGAAAGGGVYDNAGGTLVGVRCGSTDANVYDNTPDDCYIE